MNDPEKSKDVAEEQQSYDSTNTGKKPEISDTTSFKDRIVIKVTSTLNKPDENDFSLTEAIRISNNIKTILMGLFTLIGFIVLVFAIFSAAVGVELAQTATSVFLAALIAAIVGTFALFGIVVYQIRGEYKAKAG